MRIFLLFVSLLAKNPCHAAESELQAAVDGFRYSLKDFSIDARQTALGTTVQCGGEELANAIESIGGDRSVGRVLLSTEDPWAGRATWLLRDDTCESMRPYLNALGFSRFDPRTGRARLFLGAFQKKAVDREKFSASEGVARLETLLKPGFELKNVLPFDAQCELAAGRGMNLGGWGAYFGFYHPELRCTLDDGLGFVQLAAVRARRPEDRVCAPELQMERLLGDKVIGEQCK